MSNLSVKHKRELTDEIGKFLLNLIQTQATKDRVCTLVCDYVKKNKLDVNPSDLFKTIDWQVKVLLKK